MARSEGLTSSGARGVVGVRQVANTHAGPPVAGLLCLLNPHHVITLRAGTAGADGRLEGLHLHRLPISRDFLFDDSSLVQQEGGTAQDLRAPSRIFGEPEHRSCLFGVSNGRLPTARREIHRVEHGRVIGWQTVIDATGRVGGAGLHSGDNFDRLLGRNLQNHEGFFLTDDDQVVFAGREKPAFHRVSALFIPYLEPGNYGAFLIRCLPFLLFLSDTTLPAFDAYIVPERTLPVFEAMQLLGLPERPVYSVREVSGDVFQTLYVVQGEPAEGLFDPQLALRLRALCGPGDKSGRPDLIYVSRSLTNVFRPTVRPLINEPQVEALAAARGFTIVHAETFSLREQMRMFVCARAILGPSGSGMLNAVFAPPGCVVVDMESFHYTVRQHAKVYSSTGKNYAFAFGRFAGAPDTADWQRPWEVSLPLVEEAVTWALDEPANSIVGS